MLVELMRRQAKELVFCGLLGLCITRIGQKQVICLIMNFIFEKRQELGRKQNKGESNEK